MISIPVPSRNHAYFLLGTAGGCLAGLVSVHPDPTAVFRIGWAGAAAIAVLAAMPSIARRMRADRSRNGGASMVTPVSTGHPPVKEWIEQRSIVVEGLPDHEPALRLQVIHPLTGALARSLVDALTSPSETIVPRLRAVERLVGTDGGEGAFEAETGAWRAGNPPELRAFESFHAHAAPMIVEAFIRARERTRLTCQDLGFLALRHEPLWYALQNVGRIAPFPSGAGLLEHTETLMAMRPRIRAGETELFVEETRGRLAEASGRGEDR